jgi:DNA-binding MarR family transcriptional regulator
MSRGPKKTPAVAKRCFEGPPFVGAMLRLAHQTARQRILRALPEHGFTDLNQSLLNVLSYPPPDGVRPIDLAERTYMTKQAMNYLLGQLEALGYIERRGEQNGDRRLVFLTQRGWQVFEVQWSTMQQLEAEWATILGGKRFDQFMKALRCLSLPNSNDGASPSKRTDQKVESSRP